MSGGSRSSTSTRQDVATTNINVQGVQGSSIVGNGNTIISADAEIVGRGFDFAADVNRDSLEFAVRTNRDALTFADNTLDAAFTFGRLAIDEIRDNSFLTVNALSDQVDRSISGLQAFATRQSASSDDRLADFAKMALLAVAAIVIAPTVLKELN